jgi:toxin ParE1/3/4
VTEIARRFEPLLSRPEMGPRPDKLRSGIRVYFYRDYAIYYTFSNTEVVIVRVLHGARDARAQFARDDP